MEDYLTVTELPGYKASREQIERLYHRYHFAHAFCRDNHVLEVACGAGMGLGYLEKVAKKVVGGDIDENILKFAQNHYKERNKIELMKIDAHKLQFPDKSFDVVILYEAIYYLAQATKFIEEAFRVLRKDGVLLICSVNKDWAEFNPSPFSTRYFSAPELHQLLNHKFSDVKVYGAFPVRADTFKRKILSLMKRAAVKLHLIPKTMKGKEFFKRIFFGSLLSIPPEIKEELSEYVPPVSISVDSSNSSYKVIYAVARVL
jgi:ubiquinone/menaquinone biosynthesis C-methylase UbiE